MRRARGGALGFARDNTLFSSFEIFPCTLALLPKSSHFGAAVDRGATRLMGLTLISLGCVGGSSTDPVQWLGVDTRPLAVGSQIPITLAITNDGGEVEYQASSSNPSVVGIQDLGNQQLVLDVLSPGAVTLQVITNFGTGTLPVVASAPAFVTFAIRSHLPAGLDTALPQSKCAEPSVACAGFALVAGGSEVIEAQVEDASDNVLNSWGLVIAPKPATLLVTKSEPELFTLTGPGTFNQNSPIDTFVAGLADGGASQFLVAFVDSADTKNAALEVSPDNTLMVGRAFMPMPATTEVLGLGDWQFSCQPAQSCTIDQLSLSAAQLNLGGMSTTVSATVPASPASPITVTAMLQLP